MLPRNGANDNHGVLMGVFGGGCVCCGSVFQARAGAMAEKQATNCTNCTKEEPMPAGDSGGFVPRLLRLRPIQIRDATWEGTKRLAVAGHRLHRIGSHPNPSARFAFRRRSPARKTGAQERGLSVSASRASLRYKDRGCKPLPRPSKWRVTAQRVSCRKRKVSSQTASMCEEVPLTPVGAACSREVSGLTPSWPRKPAPSCPTAPTPLHIRLQSAPASAPA